MLIILSWLKMWTRCSTHCSVSSHAYPTFPQNNSIFHYHVLTNLYTNLIISSFNLRKSTPCGSENIHCFFKLISPNMFIKFEFELNIRIIFNIWNSYLNLFIELNIWNSYLNLFIELEFESNIRIHRVRVQIEYSNNIRYWEPIFVNLEWWGQ